jgi:hypothetical protein
VFIPYGPGIQDPLHNYHSFVPRVAQPGTYVYDPWREIFSYDPMDRYCGRYVEGPCEMAFRLKLCTRRSLPVPIKRGHFCKWRIVEALSCDAPPSNLDSFLKFTIGPQCHDRGYKLPFFGDSLYQIRSFFREDKIKI